MAPFIGSSSALTLWHRRPRSTFFPSFNLTQINHICKRNSYLHLLVFSAVHGVEYEFGGHDSPSTGIFRGKPRECPGLTFRKSILIRRMDLGPREVHKFMEELSKNYTGTSYNRITKNCNHFYNDVSLRLTGNLTSDKKKKKKNGSDQQLPPHHSLKPIGHAVVMLWGRGEGGVLEGRGWCPHWACRGDASE
ncbi:hypothetical protein Sjap_004915 [Stephania japonica]|uniref:PPPDE domain-containing protein n=1 Tax=Stephania japonica TaxID=461633 RepID=A0AAP0PI86_9MAGN